MNGAPRSWRVLLASSRAPYVIAGLAMLLTASSLGNGLALDDYFHRMVAQEGRGYLGEARSRLDQFAFFSADEAYREHALNVGFWPWWGRQPGLSMCWPQIVVVPPALPASSRPKGRRR